MSSNRKTGAKKNVATRVEGPKGLRVGRIVLYDGQRGKVSSVSDTKVGVVLTESGKEKLVERKKLHYPPKTTKAQAPKITTVAPKKAIPKEMSKKTKKSSTVKKVAKPVKVVPPSKKTTPQKQFYNSVYELVYFNSPGGISVKGSDDMRILYASPTLEDAIAIGKSVSMGKDTIINYEDAYFEVREYPLDEYDEKIDEIEYNVKWTSSGIPKKKAATKAAAPKGKDTTRYVLVHFPETYDRPDDFSTIAIFDTIDDAEKFANDPDIMENFGGTLEDGDFEIRKLTSIPSKGNTASLKKKVLSG